METIRHPQLKSPPKLPNGFNPALDIESLWAIRDFMDHTSCRLCFNSWALSEGQAHASDHRCGYCKRMRMIVAEILAGDHTIMIRTREKDPRFDYSGCGRPPSTSKTTQSHKSDRPKDFSSHPKEFC